MRSVALRYKETSDLKEESNHSYELRGINLRSETVRSEESGLMER